MHCKWVWSIVRLGLMWTRGRTLSQADNPPSSLQVGYGTYAQAYAALDRARAARSTGPPQPALTPHQAAPSTQLSDPDNPTRGVAHSPPRRHVHTPQPLPSSSRLNNSTRMNVPHTNTSRTHATNAPPSHPHTPPVTGGLRTPLGSSATPPMAPRLMPLPLPPSSSTSSSATPPMAPCVMPPPLPPSSSTSCNPRNGDPGISDEAAYWVVLRGPSPGVYHGKLVQISHHCLHAYNTLW